MDYQANCRIYCRNGQWYIRTDDGDMVSAEVPIDRETANALIIDDVALRQLKSKVDVFTNLYKGE